MFSRAGHSHSASSGVLSTLPKLAGSVFLCLKECGAESFLPKKLTASEEHILADRWEERVIWTSDQYLDDGWTLFAICILCILAVASFWVNLVALLAWLQEKNATKSLNPECSEGPAACKVTISAIAAIAGLYWLWSRMDGLRSASEALEAQGNGEGETFKEDYDTMRDQWGCLFCIFLLCSLLALLDFKDSHKEAVSENSNNMADLADLAQCNATWGETDFSMLCWPILSLCALVYTADMFSGEMDDMKQSFWEKREKARQHLQEDSQHGYGKNERQEIENIDMVDSKATMEDEDMEKVYELLHYYNLSGYRHTLLPAAKLAVLADCEEFESWGQVLSRLKASIRDGCESGTFAVIQRESPQL